MSHNIYYVFIHRIKADESARKNMQNNELRDSYCEQVMQKSEDHHTQVQPPRDISPEMSDNQPQVPNV